MVLYFKSDSSLPRALSQSCRFLLLCTQSTLLVVLIMCVDVVTIIFFLINNNINKKELYWCQVVYYIHLIGIKNVQIDSLGTYNTNNNPRHCHRLGVGQVTLNKLCN